MSVANDLDSNFHDGYVGISRAELEAMAESELAQWQHNHSNEPPLVTLADREWQRRMISHQLSVQYDLDARLATAAEEHSKKIAESNRTHAETLAKSTRWFTVVAALIGLIGALLGAVLGKTFEQRECRPTSTQREATDISKEQRQPATQSSSATPATSSTTSQPEKKTK